MTTVKNDGGMSLRDYFAAKSMRATVSKLDLVTNRAKHHKGARVVTDDVMNKLYESIASAAYSMADAMLKAREAGK